MSGKATGQKVSGRKVLFSLVFVLLCLTGLCACGQDEEAEEGKLYDIYYLNREETRIVKEQRYLEEVTGQVAETQLLLKELATAPDDASLKASVGTSFSINKCVVEEGQMNLDVGEDYRKLSVTTEVLVRAALVRTLSQVEGINHILMSVGGQSLTDASGAAVGPMTADTFIDNAGEEINAYEMVTLHLYFANEAGDRLVETSRTVVYNSNISMERLVVENLIKGPEAEEGYPVINPAIRVQGVTVKDGICYVNLDEGFLTQVYNVTADVAIYSLVNSLVELSNVNKVQIAVNGRTDIVFRETFNLANIYERNLEVTRIEEPETDPEETEGDTQ